MNFLCIIRLLLWLNHPQTRCHRPAFYKGQQKAQPFKKKKKTTAFSWRHHRPNVYLLVLSQVFGSNPLDYPSKKNKLNIKQILKSLFFIKTYCLRLDFANLRALITNMKSVLKNSLKQNNFFNPWQACG